MTGTMNVLPWIFSLSFFLAFPIPVAAEDAVLVGAGDIAECPLPGAAATATLLDQIAGTVFTAGDNTYANGAVEEFETCYGPTWGRHKARTWPSPGNHDYRTVGARPYYAYFGDRAGLSSQGYYSYDLQGWHIVSLNSNLKGEDEVAQEHWLHADLAAHPTRCGLAYWHHPLFSSGGHRNNPYLRPMWQILSAFGVDVVINGHDHDYERFAPQNPDGVADSVHGIQEFVVGTGGAGLGTFGKPQPNSEVRDDTTWGLLKLTLHPTSYDWEFVPIPGGTFYDAGSAVCTP
jgi:3',5'-cyclic AMP phosphodiesterase CpdA